MHAPLVRRLEYVRLPELVTPSAVGEFVPIGAIRRLKHANDARLT
jgi:hypothetical protein